MKKLMKIIAWALLIGIVVLISVIPKNVSKGIGSEKKYKAVLTVWQIDSFEGGKGSRTAFLRSVSNGFSKKYQGILTLVVSHSVESAEKSLKEGKIPDIISIGATGLDFSRYQTEVGNLSIEGGGITNKKRYFVPWAKGGYFKITRGNGGNVIISEGKYNSSLIAYALSNIKSNEYKLYNQVDAFNIFLTTKNATLIGTHRDVVRLQNREIDCNIEPLGDFCDLYQYAIITSKSNAYYSRLFIDYLLSNNVQDKLVNISMLSTVKVGLYSDNYAFNKLENQKINYIISPFTDYSTIEKIKEIAKETLKGTKDVEELIKHL